MRIPTLARQVTASTIATSVDLMMLFALVRVVGLPPAIAAIAAALGGGATNFAIGRCWVFEARGPVIDQAVRYAVLVVGGGAIVSGAVVGGLAALGLPLVVAKVLAVGLVMLGWTYPVSARIFRRRQLQALACSAGRDLQLTAG